MKVKIAITVDIDPEAWTLNYGVKGTRGIREDVKRYADDLVYTQLGQLDLLKPDVVSKP